MTQPQPTHSSTRRRRRGPLTCVLLLVLVAPSLVPPARASALPASFYSDATMRARGAIALIGDSLTIAAWVGLPAKFEEERWGPFQLEARSGRFTTTTSPAATSGIDAVRALRAGGFDPPIWVIALGTNDLSLTYDTPGATATLIDTMMREIGVGRQVVWVNTFKRYSKARATAFNHELLLATARHPGLTIADWYSLVSANLAWLTEDGAHLTLEGANKRNEFVSRAARAVAGEVLTCASAPVASLVSPRTRVVGVASALMPAIRLCRR